MYPSKKQTMIVLTIVVIIAIIAIVISLAVVENALQNLFPSAVIGLKETIIAIVIGFIAIGTIMASSYSK